MRVAALILIACRRVCSILDIERLEIRDIASMVTMRKTVVRLLVVE